MSEKEEEIGTLQQVLRAVDETESDPARHVSIQIDDGIRDAIRACKDSGKKAKFTIEVVASPQPERRVQLGVLVKATLPKPPTSAVVLYADDMGSLHRSDPAQLPLPGAGGPKVTPIKKEN